MKQIKQHSKAIIVSFTLFIGCTFCGTNLFAQNAGFNYTGVKPHSSAIFDISDSAAPGGVHKGLLIPRMTKNNRNSISGPATSLLIYQTDSTPGFYFNSGTPASKAWTPISSGGSSQWTTSGSNIYYNTGSVGIGTGTVAPTAKIHAVGTGTTTSTYSGMFQNAAGLTGLCVKDDGKVSIGSTYGFYALDVRAQGLNNTYENLFNFSVTDVPNQSSPSDYFSIANATSANGQFAPLISSGTTTNANLIPLQFRAETITANDNSSTQPMTVFDTYVSNALATLRPIAQFRNYGSARVSISPTGSIFSGVPGGNWLIDHSAQLVVVSTGSTSATFTAKFKNSASSDLLVIRSDGKVGIGVSNPSNLLELGADNAVKPNGGSWSVPSDIRLKKDTSSFSDGLDLIKKIKPIKYKYNGLACTPTDNKQCIGISAQEMQKIAPYMVRTQAKQLSGDDAAKFPYEKRFLRNDKIFAADDTIRDGSKAIMVPVYEADVLVFDPSSLVYVLINSVKELDAANADTKKENKALKDDNAAMKDDNAAMRKILDDLTKRLQAIEAKK